MLSPGSHIGPYEVIAPLGAGGMGEVVRARDARLGRDVAIKTLPDAFAHDPERLARFEREARLLASIHHPNIAGIHGVEEAEGHRHLILELVEGPTLAERIDSGPLPIEEALDIARQIAIALEFAHEHGIVHRDLKPGNVKITPGGEVKVLDFGLAKAQTGSPSSSDLSNSPTLTASPTGVGVILGTAAYMSPEQARGRPVDRRTDIWSFGCVLYEMLTGRQMFSGETVTDILARILQGEPDWSQLPPNTPPRIRALLARCLRKDPKERLRDIGDARIEIAEVIAAGPEASAAAGGAARVGAGLAWPALAGVLVLGAAIAIGAGRWLAPKPERAVRHFAIDAPQLESAFFRHPRISHDGQRIAYLAGDQLYVRDLHGFETTLVAGSNGAEAVAWSPDDRRLCFSRAGKLWTMPAEGGTPGVLCTLPDPGAVTSTCWMQDGSIVFCLFRGGLYQIPSTGGSPRLVLMQEKNEEDFHYPQALPGGRRVLMVAHRKDGPNVVVVVSLPDGKRADLRGYEHLNSAIWSPDGYLLLYRDQPIVIEAVRFSAGLQQIEGDPVRVSLGGIAPSVSADGTLLYEVDPAMGLHQMLWLDARGHVLERIGTPQVGLAGPRISRDGRRAVHTATESDVSDIWVTDLVRGSRTRVVSDRYQKQNPTWSGDEKTIYYDDYLNFVRVWSASADGSTPPRMRTPGYAPIETPDGRWLIYVREERGHDALARIPLSGDGKPEWLWRNVGSQEESPALSRDGRWLAYTSNESGQNEIYVRAYPGGAGKQPVSQTGGDHAFWAPSGNAIYYANQDTVFEVPVRAGVTLAPGQPRALFAKRDIGDQVNVCDVSTDGRFLATRRSLDDPRRGLLLVEHWAEELQRH